MVTREAIVDTIIPHDVPKPIPTRTVTTKTVLRPNSQNTDQQNTNRTNPGAEQPATEESVRLSPQLSALARKEQAFRQRELALKQREADLTEKLAKAERFELLESATSKKDYSEAEKLGLNYEEYTKFLLDKQAGEDPQAQAFKDLQAKIEKLEKDQVEKSDREFEETKTEYSKVIGELVAKDPEYSSVKELKQEAAVLQLILDDWNDGKETTVEEACKEVENLLVEQGKAFTGLTKFKPVEEERKLPPPRPSVNTLTNNMAPTGAEKRPTLSLQHLSESERYAEARRRVLAKRQQQG